MEDNFGNIDELISKYHAGEAGVEEVARVEAWSRESEDNRIYFEQSKKLFEAIAAADIDLPVDVDAAWQNLDARITHTGETKVISLWQKFSPLKVAASVALLLTLGVTAAWLFRANPQPTVILASNTTLEQKLPDGSKVFMNKNSEISFEQAGNKRLVKLKGEAFFEVIHNEEQPFEIEVNGVLIQDIGTAFNVKALRESDLVEVFVESGEVKFYSTTSQGLNLVKGEKAVYDKKNGTFTKISLTPLDNTMSYRSKVFHFSDAPLNQVIETINGVYNSNIQLLNEKLGNCRLSVDFNNAEVDMIVSIIAETFDLEVENKEGAIVLKGNACSE